MRPITIMIIAIATLAACDPPEADSSSQIRRDQLSSDLRSYTPPDAGGPRGTGGSGTRMVISADTLGDEGGSITLTAEGSVATVQLANGTATCLGTGETLDGPHLVGADLKSGLLDVHSDDGSMTCAASGDYWETGRYSIWVASRGG